jgi:DNA repair protein RecN (Recombination protein N)
MLTDLVVQGLGVIEATELTLEEGCSALTGETGAGKTLVVAAVGLLMGGRADRTMVRAGADRALIQGRFVIPAEHEAVDALRRLGLVSELTNKGGDVEVVVARSISRDGRTTVRVNGHLATAAAVAEACASLVEIAGQHEHARLGSSSLQRRLLDAYAGPETRALAGEVASAVGAYHDARRAAEAAASGARSRGREIAALRHEVDEIARARVTSGEGEELAREAGRLEHAESIAAGVGAAIEALRAERGAAELLAEAAGALRRLARHDLALARAAERLETVAYEADDIAQDLSTRLVPPDPERLEAVHDRRALLSRLRRKYGATEGAVLAYLDDARARLEGLEAAESAGDDLEGARDRAAAAAEDLAARLSATRKGAGERLQADMASVLGELALDGARFEVALEPRPLYEGGSERVRFDVATNPGEPPRPVAKVASGGELARIALALNLLVGSEAARTMVFDEVDAGVGGEAAQAVGRCLAQLARRAGGQVLVVTHLPQVAAFADTHLAVTKETDGKRATARVHRVDGDERVAELSRMLAGLPESRRARSHARELLKHASALVAG